jgi:hypothetical protein
VLIRPEAADARAGGTAGANIVSGRLLDASFRGSYYLIRTEHANGVRLLTEISGIDAELPEPGEDLALWLDPNAITLLPP